MLLIGLKVFAENILDVEVQMIICVTDWVENIVGKVERSIFSFSYNVFKRLLFKGC